MKGKLNKRQEAFAIAYASIGQHTYCNATKSAIEAGYSKKTAYQIGHNLLKKIEIQDYINKVKEKHFDENILTSKEVLYLLSRIATGVEEDTDNLVTEMGIEQKTRPARISDRNKALEALGKHHQLFTDKQQVDLMGGVIFKDDIE